MFRSDFFDDERASRRYQHAENVEMATRLPFPYIRFVRGYALKVSAARTAFRRVAARNRMNYYRLAYGCGN